MDIEYLKNREKIQKYTKELKKDEDSNIVKTNKVKLYDFYKCDYCNNEIRLDAKQSERSGGIVTFPHSLTKSGEIVLVLCNKCLNKAVNEFKRKYKK